MSEIKSTLDIVLEKTKHLTLSQDEKQNQQKKEARQNLAGLLQKYQDSLVDIDRLKDSLNQLMESYDDIDNQVLVGEILDRIELEKDNTPLMAILDEICQLDANGLKAVLSDYEKTLAMRKDQRTDQILEKLARDHRISGSAILPNLTADDKWSAELQSINTDYNRRLDGEKAALGNKV